jgi:hypothetical protein
MPKVTGHKWDFEAVKARQLEMEKAIEQAGLDGKINNIAPSLRHMVVDCDKLSYDPDNARAHDRKSIDGLKLSFETYGQVKPIVARRSNNVVISGNGALEAVRELGWTQIAVSYSDLNDIEAMGYALADNRTAELSRWNFEVVARQQKLLGLTQQPAIGWTIKDMEGILRSQQEGANADGELMEKWSVLIECESETDQLLMIERLTKEGRTCKALTF